MLQHFKEGFVQSYKSTDFEQLPFQPLAYKLILSKTVFHRIVPSQLGSTVLYSLLVLGTLFYTANSTPSV